MKAKNIKYPKSVQNVRIATTWKVKIATNWKMKIATTWEQLYNLSRSVVTSYVLRVYEGNQIYKNTKYFYFVERFCPRKACTRGVYSCFSYNLILLQSLAGWGKIQSIYEAVCRAAPGQGRAQVRLQLLQQMIFDNFCIIFFNCLRGSIKAVNRIRSRIDKKFRSSLSRA